MAFRKVINEKTRIRHASPTGDKVTIIKGWTYKDGEYVYEQKKVHPHYEETQAARDSVDLDKILERYNAGDKSALEKVTGFYADIADIPKTYGEIYDAVSQTNELFSNLPAELKDKFNNNPAEFWKSYGTKDFDVLVNDYRDAVIGANKHIETASSEPGPIEKEVIDNVEKSE